MAWNIDVKYKIHQHLANEIFFRIYNGTYPLGTKLLSYQNLSKEAGCSPETVRRALLVLLSRGVVEKTRFGYRRMAHTFLFLIANFKILRIIVNISVTVLDDKPVHFFPPDVNRKLQPSSIKP